MILRALLSVFAATAIFTPATGFSAAGAAEVWKIGDPIVSYWAGPGFPGGGPLDDTAAIQLREGGWNVVWCHENELDTAQRHGLRGMLVSDLLRPGTLDDPKQKDALDALIGRVGKHPAFYIYHLTDEPAASAFPALGRLVAYLRERDPGHPAYINLLPTYASNEQLGTKGGAVPAYQEHLRRFVETVRPALLSYDHYQFTNSGDQAGYFLNLALMRDRSLASGIPFMNIVQASAWGPTPLASPSGPRVPEPEELRYLVNTTLAYGAQGISYYVYCYPDHLGGIARPDGTTTPLYTELKTRNPEFVRMARELQPLRSLGVFHTGMLPPGAVPLPKDCAVTLDPPAADIPYQPGTRVQGVLLSRFGPAENPDPAAATHFVVVNLDYKTERAIGLRAAGPLELFDAAEGRWLPASGTGATVTLTLPGGGGKLARLRP